MKYFLLHLLMIMKMTDLNNELIYTGKLCPYCFKKTVYVDSSEVYDVSHGMIYLCRPCKAWVGVHEGTNTALGRVANVELRSYKKEAHFYFDQLWQVKITKGFTKGDARTKAYSWLSNELVIPRQNTHIGWFDIDMCKKVVEICKPFALKINNTEFNG